MSVEAANKQDIRDLYTTQTNGNNGQQEHQSLKDRTIILQILQYFKTLHCPTHPARQLLETPTETPTETRRLLNRITTYVSSSLPSALRCALARKGTSLPTSPVQQPPTRLYICSLCHLSLPSKSTRSRARVVTRQAVVHPPAVANSKTWDTSYMAHVTSLSDIRAPSPSKEHSVRHVRWTRGELETEFLVLVVAGPERVGATCRAPDR